MSKRGHKDLFSEAKLREPAYSQALKLKQNRQAGGQYLESQAGRQSEDYGGWCLELRRGGMYGKEDESG